MLLVAILTLFAVEWVQEFEPRPVGVCVKPLDPLAAYLCAIYTIALFGVRGAQFIYFSSESLACVGVVEARKHQQEDDLEVEEKRPPDVVEVDSTLSRPSSRGCRSCLASR